jgi:L-lactate utilization protein LutB
MSREREIETIAEKRADRVIKNLRRRGMEGFFAKDKEEANRKILSLLAPGSTVAWGGSVTLSRDLQTLDLIRTGGFKAIDREAAKTPEEIEKAYRDAFFSDTYLLSANAITVDGKIVNVDGRGNRVAAMAYGPRQVILVAGCNKICPSLETALERARNEAAPLNTERLSRKTPCREDGVCHHCLVEDCVCCMTVVTRKSVIPGRIKVILVGEDLGF